MDFKKKLKQRLYLAVGYIVIGVIISVAGNVKQIENHFFSTFGITLIVCGIARVRNYFIITRNEETIRKQQIAETDERNISICNRAKTAAFSIYILITCAAVIVLEILNKTELVTVLTSTICVLVMIYWISYWIIRRKC